MADKANSLYQLRKVTFEGLPPIKGVQGDFVIIRDSTFTDGSKIESQWTDGRIWENHKTSEICLRSEIIQDWVSLDTMLTSCNYYCLSNISSLLVKDI